MATNPHDERKLPWPEESDPAKLGEEFAQQPQLGDGRALGRSFEDPNSVDDGRLGKSFEESNFSGKHEKPPLKDRVHAPENKGTVVRVVVIALIVFALLALVGWFFHHRDSEDTQKLADQQKNTKPVVETAQVQPGKDAAGLVVPGTTIPLTEAYVYPRANGYLKKRLVDIGDHVHQGQLLAIIDAPDLDAQVAQARQQLAQAEQQLDQQRSQLALATVTVNRYRVLVAKGVFSRQDGDTQETNYSSNLANVAAAQRNVNAFKDNLAHEIALQGYEYVRAPFTGVVIERNSDVGALVSSTGTSGSAGPAPMGQNSSSGGTTQAGATNNGGVSGSPTTAATSAQTPGQAGPLFAIAQNTRLRILVSVPEGYATDIHVGAGADVQFQEYSGKLFHGKITRTADSVDANTRTLLTEVQIDNSQGKLVPGMYTVVTFAPPPGEQAPLLIVGDAVVIRQDRSMVAKVVNGKVHYVPVVLGRDFGSAIEIMNGLQPGDVIVTDVTDNVAEGAEVKVHMAASPEQSPQKPPSQTRPPGGASQYGDEGISDQNLQGAQSQQNQSGKTQGQSKGVSAAKRSATEGKP